jgi:acetoin utilization deacetylase AcuC-like enzyme
VDHNIVNLPLPRGCNSELFRARIESGMLPPIRNFDSQLIIISAGFDAHRLDPLAGLNLEDSDFKWITTELVRIADTACEGRIVSILEGGYSLEALTTGTTVHVRALMGTAAD